MLKSFFFVPANKLRFLEKSKDLPARFIVFDLEDAVLRNEIDSCIQNLSQIELQQNHLVRFRFFDDSLTLDECQFEALLNLGFRHFVIPKFGGIEQAKYVKSFLVRMKLEQDVSFVLLIEHPSAVLTLHQSLLANLVRVTGIGLGSHDYCNAMSMKHTTDNLNFVRQMILNNAKAFELDAIDTVSVNIENDLEFRDESLNAFHMGFEGKFLIHPRQLQILNELKYYSNEDVDEAVKVYDKVKEIQEHKTSIVRIDGKIYEKPHIDRIINIIKWNRDYGSK